MKLRIISENNNYLVVDKPAGLLVYLPEGAKNEETLIDLLSDKINFEHPDNRSGIVHRLDRDTSGIILVAKNLHAEEELKKVFKERKIKKIYQALVFGKVEPEEGEIRIPLGRGSKDRLKVVPAQEGRESVTRYKLVKYFPHSDMSLLKVDLLTGRTHQIRVHFASIGHSVVGDNKYSNKKVSLSRQFLHAAEISFKDPFQDKAISYNSELPSDLNMFLNNLN